MREWPTVVFKEESMREGMQIEDATIPVEDKVRLLHALGETGLKHIVVGPKAHEGGISPWREPIRSEQRPETLSL